MSRLSKAIILGIGILFGIMISSCSTQKESNVTLTIDHSFDDKWNNKTKFSETQDYITNLDYSLLADTTVNDTYKHLFTIIHEIMEGNGLSVIPMIQGELNNIENSSLRKLYGDLVFELLVDAEKYGAAISNFPEATRKDIISYSKFPLSSFKAAKAEDVIYNTLSKYEIGYFGLDIMANNHAINAYFDTGSEMTHLSKSFADNIGLQYNSTEKILVTTSNSMNIYGCPSYVDTLIIGNVLLFNHPVLIFDDEILTIEDDGMEYKLDFTIGWTIIKNIKFELDFINNKYSALVPKKKSSQQMKNLFWLGYPGLKVNSIDGQSLIFGFDTGSKHTEFRNNCLLKMEIPNIAEKMVRIGGLGGVEIKKAQVGKQVPIILAKHKIMFKEIEILEGKDLYFIVQDGTIGADIFYDNIIIIDYPNGLFEIK